MALAVASPELPPSSKAEETMEVRPPLSGWLLKRKSGKGLSRVISSTNRRYFTLDFTAQVLYYSHTESSKSVSQPMAFRHILRVEPLSVAPAAAEEAKGEEASQEAPPQRQTSKSSVGSGFRIPKMPSLPGLGSRRPSVTEQHGFTLVCASKTLELLCTSKEEAETWVDAVREAIALGSTEKFRSSASNDDAKAEISTAPGSRNSSSPRSDPDPEEDSDEEEGEAAEETRTVNLVQVAAEKAAACTIPAKQSSGEDSSASPVEEVSVAALEPVQDTSAIALESARGESCAPGLPPRIPKKVERPVPASTPSPEPRASSAASPVASAEEVSATGVEEETINAVSASGASSSPRNDAQAWEVSNGEDGLSGPKKSASERYADKAEGLTLAQRLSQLDFSDDEDEENPTSSKEGADQAGESKKEVCSSDPVTGMNAAEEKKSSVVVEACESFVQEADSDDD